jgi:hypothetical protein
MVAPWLMLRFAPRGADAGHAGGAWRGVLGRLYRRAQPPMLQVQGAGLGLPAVIVGVATWRSLAFYTRDVTVKLLPFDNKSELQVVSTCRRALTWRRPSGPVRCRRHRRRSCPSRSPCRPMPAPPRRSTSTAWCATPTCAGRRSWAMCRSTCAQDERSRSSHDVALDLRQRLKALSLPEGSTRQGGGAAARPAGAGDAAGRDLRPGCATRRAVARQGEEAVRAACPTSSMSTTAMAVRARACACRSTRSIWSSSASSRRRL